MPCQFSCEYKAWNFKFHKGLSDHEAEDLIVLLVKLHLQLSLLNQQLESRLWSFVHSEGLNLCRSTFSSLTKAPPSVPSVL